MTIYKQHHLQTLNGENENLCESAPSLSQHPKPWAAMQVPSLRAAEQSCHPVSVMLCQLPQVSTGGPPGDGPQGTAPRWLQGWGAGPQAQVLQSPRLPQSRRQARACGRGKRRCRAGLRPSQELSSVGCAPATWPCLSLAFVSFPTAVSRILGPSSNLMQNATCGIVFQFKTRTKFLHKDVNED